METMIPSQPEAQVQPVAQARTPFLKTMAMHVAIAALLVGGTDALIEKYAPVHSDLPPAQEWFNHQKADYIVLGNSIARSNVNTATLNERFEGDFVMYNRDGSYSAFWYLAVKNLFMQLKTKPKAILIIFRETDLTDPTYGVQGYRESDLVKMSVENEPVLTEKVWKPVMGGAGNMLFQNVPFIHGREAVKAKIYPTAKAMTMLLFDRQDGDIGVTINKMMNALIRPAARGEDPGEGSDRKDFDSRLDASLLPDIIEVAKRNDVTLVMVRAKKKAYVSKPQSAEMAAYMEHLKAYLEKNGAFLIDYGGLANLTEKDFTDGDHLNERGKVVFTDALSYDLLGILR